MRRAPVAFVATLLGGAIAAAPAVAAKHPAYSNILINAQEYSLFASRATVPAGTVAVELWNRGEDPHDTWIRRLNVHGQMTGPVLGRVRITPQAASVTRPGTSSQADTSCTARCQGTSSSAWRPGSGSRASAARCTEAYAAASWLRMPSI